MQIAIGAQARHRPTRAAARLCSLIVGVALILFAVGTAAAVVRGPATPGFDHRGPATVRSGGAAPMSIPDGAPGDTAVSYTTITYEGSSPATVRLFADVSGTGLAPHLDVRIERGSGERDTWTPEGSDPIFEGTLAQLPIDWSAGLTGGRAWSAGERHTYRITVTLLDHTAAQGRTAAVTFHWESRTA
jgi:hypothetical protein